MPNESRTNRDESEVIMENMDETRKDLAGKLEQLEKKVTGTVESVTNLVEKVPETVDTVKETIAETVSTVTETVQHTVEAVKGTVESTVGSVKETMAETVESVKSFFDVPHQVDRHPWLMLGGSVLLGYVGGRLLTPRRRAADKAPAFRTTAPEPAFRPSYESSYAPAAPAAPRAESARAQETEARPSQPSWLSRIGEQFASEIDKVKELAIGTLLGVARDMVTRSTPENLRHDVSEIINNFTTDLGGKVFKEPFLAQEQGSQGDGRGAAEWQGAAASAARSGMA